MKILKAIKKCFNKEQVFYSHHARKEMVFEELGRIKENEVFESVQNGEILEDYPDDKPYPSVLILGFTQTKKPLHVVCAYDRKDDLAIVITTYRPNPERWINFRRRRKL